MYREGRVEATMLEIKKSPGGVRVIPQWGETFRGEDSPRKLASEDALAKRLQESKGFQSYGGVQQWLATTLGIEAEYHAVYQMTRYRLLRKTEGRSSSKLLAKQRATRNIKKNLQTTLGC